MNVLVLDVAASESGAVSILRNYYDAYSKDKENHYYFCISTVELAECDNITVLKYPWVKMSWGHRLWFDNVVCPQLIKRLCINRIVSLQNTLVPSRKIETLLYLHQSLPFVSYKYRITEDFKLWVYQNVISKWIIISAKRANSIIVQTEWMKRALIEKCGISDEKIAVIRPDINISINKKFRMTSWDGSFIYPATAYSYKNHLVLFKAARWLKEQGIKNFQINLTLSVDELSEECKALYREVSDVIHCHGRYAREELMEQYSKSVLLFPSFVETFGLPLLEARVCDDYVIAADTPFAKEILDGYEHCSYFTFDDHEQCAKEIRSMLERKCW